MVPDTEVLTRAGIPSIHTLLQRAQVRWAGHVIWMPDDRLHIWLMHILYVRTLCIFLLLLLLLPILCRAASSAALSHTGGFLEWEVESTTVTHSSADWWDLLLPLA